jgi:uncharacterized RDD family membrane protein YckC
MSPPHPSKSRCRPQDVLRRVAALLLDTAVLSPVGIVIWRRQRRSGTGRPVRLRTRVVVELLKATYFIVPTVMIGGTPGKRLVGLRVIDVDSGQAPGWKQASVRWAAAALPGLAVGAATRAYLPRALVKPHAKIAELDARAESLIETYSEDPEGLEEAREALYVEMSILPMVTRKLLLPLALAMICSGASTAFVLLDRQSRGVHDRLANTLVVRSRRR